METAYQTHSAEETRSLGKEIAGSIVPGTILCLRGDLGAGKTTFTQGLLEGFGASRPYVSPTFVIMKQYDLLSAAATGIERVYHADAYRVETKDFETIGFAEWRDDPKGVVILEWPERVAGLIPPGAMHIAIAAKSETEREIRIRKED